MVFLLLRWCLVLVLELHLSNISLLVNEIHCDVVECCNLLLDAYNLDSRDIFEQVVCCHDVLKAAIDCSSDQILHILNQISSFLGSGLEAVPDAAVPVIGPVLILFGSETF